MRLLLWVLRLVTIAALAVDAYIHADRAAEYDLNKATISQGFLFRAQAGVAAAAALLLLLVATRITWAIAALVLATALAAVLLYTYQDVGAIGPFPDMYEPLWYPKKTISAVAEGVGAATALAGLVLTWVLMARSRIRSRERRPVRIAGRTVVYGHRRLR